MNAIGDCFKLYYNLLILFTVKPQSVEVRTGDGQVLADGAVLGPLLERTRVNVSCLVREGKPQPKVAWYFNGKEMLDGAFKKRSYLHLKGRQRMCGSSGIADVHGRR
ncbi:hypothetical protein RR46_07213 [Papilio xuthus]|uniref:Ig-like domain-containing protein n=1 Tax=Papilio xuthus TaxID=66420 RepID=A0A194Q509_PAPXU|nr:hypothetical protein RR46_07213 [Papilio xuthus]